MMTKHEFMRLTRGYSAWTVAKAVNSVQRGIDYRGCSKKDIYEDLRKQAAPSGTLETVIEQVIEALVHYKKQQTRPRTPHGHHTPLDALFILDLLPEIYLKLPGADLGHPWLGSLQDLGGERRALLRRLADVEQERRDTLQRLKEEILANWSEAEIGRGYMAVISGVDVLPRLKSGDSRET
jgi:hypothetical protein